MCKTHQDEGWTMNGGEAWWVILITMLPGWFKGHALLSALVYLDFIRGVL